MVLTLYCDVYAVHHDLVRQEGVESHAGDAGVVVLAPCLVLYHRRVTKLKQFVDLNPGLELDP